MEEQPKVYKILIKSTTKNIYYYYQNPEDKIDFQTTDIDELKEKYEALLEVYTKGQIKLIHELQPDFEITIETCGSSYINDNTIVDEPPQDITIYPEDWSKI